MTTAIARDPIYRRRRFQAEIIELCVRWYITYRLSYRDLVAMMAERGVDVSHTTILRWVLRYVPEFEKRWARYARRVNSSWRVDETSVPRAGRTALSVSRCRQARQDGGLSAFCRIAAGSTAQSFFKKAVVTHLPRWPRKVTLDGNGGSHRALRQLRAEDPRWQSCRREESPLPQQHRRAGSSSDQTSLRSDAGLQVIQNCGYHAGWR